MRTAVKALIKLRVRTHTHTEILLTAVETLLPIMLIQLSATQDMKVPATFSSVGLRFGTLLTTSASWKVATW